MIPTESLVSTIVADHAAKRDADPQEVIARLKQDLRAARQAATKARKYAERMRDGDLGPEIAALRTQIETLTAENEVLRNRVNLANGRHSQAAKRAHQFEMAYRRLQEENARLDASERDVAAFTGGTTTEPDELFPNIDPELVELRRLITALREADHETFAPAVCWALNNVKVITAGLRDATGKVRIPVRRRAA